MKPLQFVNAGLSQVKKGLFVAGLAGSLLLMSACGGSSSEEVTMTQGLITDIKEVKTDLFKITDEEVVPNVADSRIRATYMDGTTEEFTLEEAKLVDASDTTSRRGRIRSAAFGGIMGYYMGRSLSSGTNSGVYANKAAHAKSNIAKSKVSSSAVRSGKSGFGKGRSGRSFGG